MENALTDVHDHQHDQPGAVHEHDLGLTHDLSTLLNRRRALAVLGGGLGLAALAACGTGTGTSSTSGPSSAGTSRPTGGGGGTTTVENGTIPEETGGPYPADGSNGVNVLTESGVVRSDITRSFASAAGVATGVPLTVRLKVVDVSEGGAALDGAAVYLWHCDSEGRYSMYDQGTADENYLRGVQATDADGEVTFTTIYPGAYPGRWPHMHFEIYPSIAAATTAGGKMRTSQLALPEDISAQVYGTAGYDGSTRNLSQTSLERDNVFSDGYSLQLATVTGTVAGGLTATLNVPV